MKRGEGVKRGRGNGGSEEGAGEWREGVTVYATPHLRRECDEGADELVSNQVGMIGKLVRAIGSIFAGFAANLVHR